MSQTKWTRYEQYHIFNLSFLVQFSKHFWSNISSLFHQLFRSSNISLFSLRINTWSFIFWILLTNWNMIWNAYGLTRASLFPIYLCWLYIDHSGLLFFLLDNSVFCLDLFLFLSHYFFHVKVLYFLLLLLLIYFTSVKLSTIHKVLNFILFFIVDFHRFLVFELSHNLS